METDYINVREYAHGDIIFSQGDESHCMYEVKRGRVGIYLNYGTKEEKLLSELTEGAAFGEMGMVEGVPRSASAVCLEDRTQVAEITWPLLGKYFKTKPSHVVQIMQQTSDRLRRANERNEEARRAIEAAVAAAEEQDCIKVRRILNKFLKETR